MATYARFPLWVAMVALHHAWGMRDTFAADGYLDASQDEHHASMDFEMCCCEESTEEGPFTITVQKSREKINALGLIVEGDHRGLTVKQITKDGPVDTHNRGAKNSAHKLILGDKITGVAVNGRKEMDMMGAINGPSMSVLLGQSRASTDKVTITVESKAPIVSFVEDKCFLVPIQHQQCFMTPSEHGWTCPHGYTEAAAISLEPPSCFGQNPGDHVQWVPPQGYRHDEEALQKGSRVLSKRPFRASSKRIEQDVEGSVVRVNERGDVRVRFDSGVGEVDVLRDDLSNLAVPGPPPDPYQPIKQQQLREAFAVWRPTMATLDSGKLVNEIMKGWEAGLEYWNDDTMKAAIALLKQKRQPNGLKVLQTSRQLFEAEQKEKQEGANL